MFIGYYLFSACLCLLLYRKYLFIIKLSQEGDRDKENWSLGMQLANYYISGDY